MTNQCLRTRAETIDPGRERFPDLRAGSTAGMDSFVRARALTIRASDALALLFALATLASPFGASDLSSPGTPWTTFDGWTGTNAKSGMDVDFADSVIASNNSCSGNCDGLLFCLEQ
jgi:hypothetical protein